MSTKEFYTELGARIRGARINRGLSQSQVANYVGLQRASISNIENGRQQLLAHTWFSIMEILGVSPDKILNGMMNDQNRQSSNHDAIRQELLEKLSPNESEIDALMKKMGI